MMRTRLPFRVAVATRYNDIDERGVVNNAVYVTYLEEARVAWFGELRRFHDADFRGNITVAHVEVDYRAPLVLGDGVDVELVVDRIGTSSFGLRYRVLRTGDGLLAAEAATTLVHFDYESRRPVPLSGMQRGVLELYMMTSA